MSRTLRQINPSESVHHLFAWTLREQRVQAGFGLQGFAKRLGKSDSYLSAVELAEVRCTRAFAEACDELLDAQGKLVNLWVHADREWDQLARKPQGAGAKPRRAERPTPAAGSSPSPLGGAALVQLRAVLGYAGLDWAAEAILLGAVVEFDVLAAEADECWVRIGERDVLMDRRDFLTLLAFCTSLGVAPVRRALDEGQIEQFAAAMRRPQLADPQVPLQLRRVLKEQRALDDLLGPGTLLRPVTSQITMIERLLLGAKTQVRELLLPVAGEWAQFAWWLALDARDLHLAKAFYGKAVEWAHDGGDARLSGYLLTCRSELAVVEGDFEEARRLTEAAGRDEWHPTPGLKAWAALRQAHAHALAGERDACERQLGAAEDLLATSTPSDEPSYIYWFGSEYLSGDRGMCYVELGLGRQAVEHIGRELDVLAPVRERDRGWCLIRQGEAYELADEPEQAGRVAGEALTMAGRTGSVRTLEKVRKVHSSMAQRWPELAVTRSLGEQLHDAPPGGGPTAEPSG